MERKPFFLCKSPTHSTLVYFISLISIVFTGFISILYIYKISGNLQALLAGGRRSSNKGRRIAGL